MRAYEAALAAQWAMSEEWIETVLTIAQRQNDVSVDALEAYRARAVGNAERLVTRNGVGILSARGPMFRYANLFTELSGATSYDTLRKDLQVAIDAPEIRAVLLNIDSPGGEANGAGELAQAVYEARDGGKPIWAYVGGTGASAAYWIAAGASKIVANDSAVLGSIGVRAAISDRRKVEEGRGVRTHVFVSSQSPNKDKPADLDTEDGRARIQRTIDALAQVFVEKVAQYRGVSAADVIEKFGGGDVKVGAHAVSAGLADELGTFEGVLASLSRTPASPARFRASAKGSVMTETTGAQPGATTGITQAQLDKATSDAKTEAGKAAQARIKGILGHENAKGRGKLANHLAFDTDMSVEQAAAVMAASAVEQPDAGVGKTPTIEQRMAGQGKDLAMGAPMKPAAAVTPSDAKDELNAGAIYGARAKARGQRAA